MADIIPLSLQLDPSQANQSVGSFKQQLKLANEELIKMQSQFGETSDEAVKAAKAVAGLKDQLGDAQKLTAAFDPDRKFSAVATAVQGIAGGFTALTGAMALFGVQSDEVQKTLLKVQGALALSQGINDLLELGKGFKNLKLVAIDAFNGIKAAIGSSGIGLIVLVVAAIAANWDKIKAAVFGVNKQMEDTLELAKDNVKVQQDKLDVLNSQDNILKLQGKSEKEILQLKEKQTQAVIDAEEKQLESQKAIVKAQVETSARNKEILTGILKFIDAPLNLILYAVDKITGLFGKGTNLAGALDKTIANLIFDPEDAKKKGDETIAEIQKDLDKLKNQKAGFELQVQAIDKKSAADAKAINDKKVADAQKLQDELYQIHLKTQLLLQDGITTQAQQQADEAEAAKEKKKQDDEADAARYATQQENLNKIGKSGLIQQVENERAASDAKIRIAEAEKQAKLENLQAVGNGLNALADLVGQQTVAGKILSIASATINTYVGATKALAQGGFLGIAGAAAVIVSGLASVKKIIQTKIPGGKDAGGGSPASSIPTQAALPIQNPVVRTNTTLDANSINAVGNAAAHPVQAYVIESQGADAQERTTRINRAARLGG